MDEKNIENNSHLLQKSTEKHTFLWIELIKKHIFPSLLNEIKKLIPKISGDELMTIEQVCKFFQKSKSTIWKWTKDEVIIGYKMKGTVYYKRSEIYNTIDKNKI